MRRGAGLDTNEARGKLLKERQDVAALQLTADEHVAFRVDAVHLKYRLRYVETDVVTACMMAPPNRQLTAPHTMHRCAGGWSRPQHH